MLDRFRLLLVAATVFAAAIASTPVPLSAQIPISAVGVPKAILDPSGVKISVVVNAFQSPPKGVQDDSPPGGGRWVVLDLSVTNVGTTPYQFNAGDFQMMAPDTTIYRPDGNPDLPVPQLSETALMPGDTLRGNVVFAIPSGVMLQLVTFQASGTAQWVVALLS